MILHADHDLLQSYTIKNNFRNQKNYILFVGRDSCVVVWQYITHTGMPANTQMIWPFIEFFYLISIESFFFILNND